MKIITASYGARLRGSLFKIKFRVLAGDFESIETFAGFVQLLAENWVQTHTKINNQDHIFLAFSKYLI